MSKTKLVTDPNLASWRNLSRLATKLVPMPDGLRIAETLDKSMSEFEKLKRDGGDVCCPLPFSLQDLCLLVVVCDLDFHQVEMLASLPHWLRHRLLNVIPALDLCRLEHTSVATGVDVDAIWNSRWKERSREVPVRVPAPSLVASLLTWYSQSPSIKEKRTPGSFQLKVGAVGDMSRLGLLSEPSRDTIELKEMTSAFQGIEECQLPHGKEILLAVASDILSKVSSMDLDMAANKLISVESDVVFSSLLTGSMHQPCPTPQCSQNVWKKQPTGLAVNVHSLQWDDVIQDRYSLLPFLHHYGGRDKTRDIQLTPHRLLHILYRRDPLELLTLLARDCNLRLSSASIHIESLSESLLQDLCTERLALDLASSLPSDRVPCTTVVHHFLQKVAILRLQCDNYSNIGVMIGMIKATTIGGENSQLKHLFCIMKNIYLDTVQPFALLFSLQNFHQLLLEVDEVCPLMLFKLLQGFITSPCPQTHKLTILSQKGIQLPKSLKENQVATLEKGVPLPSCGAQHKILQFSSDKEFTNTLYLLLQLPTIRVKEIVLVDLDEYHQYVHFCAIHPDLQVTKLVIDLYKLHNLGSSELATIQRDLVTLIAMKSLRKICISGSWGQYAEVKLGLVQGLQHRSSLHPLRKIAFELQIANSYKIQNFQMLCDAVFSLPHLEDLKVVLGNGFADMIKQPGYEEVMYKSWIRKSSRVQLKSLRFQTYERKFEQLSHMTKELSFSTKQRIYPPRRYADAYSDDEYCYDDYYDDYPYYSSTGYEDGYYCCSSDDEYGYY